MDISGKTVIVTGANSGLGLAVSKQLASMKVNAVMVCRNKDKGEAALSEVKNHVPGASVELMLCDLSSIKSVNAFIDEFKKNHSQLDILYNNAAVMKRTRTITKDGFEMMFQVNYLSPFILMNSLLEVLKKSSSPYIINISRPEDDLRLDLDDLQASKTYSMYPSFFKTKLMLLFATLELARRQGTEGITVTSLDPGPFKSDLVRDIPIAAFFKNLFSGSVEKAASNIVSHITAEDIKSKNGRVFKERQEYPLIDYWKDTSISDSLWSATESLMK